MKDQITTKSMPYEAFKDNEYIENLVGELRASGTNVLVGVLDDLINCCLLSTSPSPRD